MYEHQSNGECLDAAGRAVELVGQVKSGSIAIYICLVTRSLLASSCSVLKL